MMQLFKLTAFLVISVVSVISEFSTWRYRTIQKYDLEMGLRFFEFLLKLRDEHILDFSFSDT